MEAEKEGNPKCRDPPTAMLDASGNLTTSEKRIKELALETYQKRLENRPMKDHLLKIKEQKEELFEVRMKRARNGK